MGNSKLINKFIIFLIFTSIIPLLFLGVISYNASKNAIYQRAKIYAQDNLQDQRKYLELVMDETENLMINISSKEELRDILSRKTVDDQFTKLTAQNDIGIILSEYTHLKGLVSIDIFTINNDHYHVGDTLNADSINEEVKDKIYQEVVSAGQQTKWIGIENNVNMDSRTSKVITAAKLLKTTDPKTLEEKNIGLLLINSNTDNLYSNLYDENLDKDSYMMIIDESSRLVFFSDKTQIGSVAEENFINKLTDNEGSFTEVINGQQMLVTYTKSAKSNWLLVSLIPISVLTTGITSIGNNTMILLGLCLLIVILAAGFISKKVVLPINAITGRFKEIEQGSMNMELMNEKIYKDEIGELIKWFNTFLINLVANRKMQEELRNAHDDLEKRVETRTSELAYLSLHDSLTDLNNRASFEQKMAELRKSNACNQSIIVIDVDGLKLVNDSLGHNQGDVLLNSIAKMIKFSMRENDFISRIGGDEFAVILNTIDKKDVENVCNRLRKAVSDFNINNLNLPISISIGYSMCADPTDKPDKVFKEADNNMYREKLFQSNSTRSAIVSTMMKALEERDFITEGHVERVQNLVVEMGNKLCFGERQMTDLKLLAQFHDIGKVGIPDSILFKTGGLTDNEMTVMKRHSEIGFRIANSAPDLVPIADWILKHHECWDGSGYPLGIRGLDIPLKCRILHIVDAYDAMTSDRPYRKAMTNKEAIEELKRNSGKQFDPDLVPLFIEIIKDKN